MRIISGTVLFSSFIWLHHHAANEEAKLVLEGGGHVGR